MALGPVEAAGTVDAQTAPTAPWKTLRVFHELPQGILSTKSSTDRFNHPQILLRSLIISVSGFGARQGSGDTAPFWGRSSPLTCSTPRFLVFQPFYAP